MEEILRRLMTDPVRPSFYDYFHMKRLGVAIVVGALAVVVGCSSASPPTQSAAPATSLATLAASPTAGTALNTQQPDLPWQYATLEEVSTVYTPPSLLPGYQCHPCHNLQEDQLFSVARGKPA